MDPTLNFTSILDLERWAATRGVRLEVLGRLGEPGTLTLSWIERTPKSPKGTGREVIQALLKLADAHRQDVDLLCLGGGLEAFYTELGFEAYEASRDEETWDVEMRRPFVLPVPQACPEACPGRSPPEATTRWRRRHGWIGRRR